MKQIVTVLMLALFASACRCAPRCCERTCEPRCAVLVSAPEPQYVVLRARELEEAPGEKQFLVEAYIVSTTRSSELLAQRIEDLRREAGGQEGGLTEADLHAGLKPFGAHVVQAPKFLALADQTASVFIGDNNAAGGIQDGFTMEITPTSAAEGVRLDVRYAIWKDGRRTHFLLPTRVHATWDTPIVLVADGGQNE